MQESRRDRFIRLAQKRVTRAIKDIRLIGNLSNAKIYGYEQKDVDKIIRALDREVKAAKARFENDQASDNIAFKL